MPTFTEIDYLPTVGAPDGATITTKIYTVEEDHGAGDGGVSAAIFTSVASQQAYTVAALAGKATADILNIIIGQTVISSGDYGLSGTTLTFAEPNPMPGTKRIVVYFK